MTPKSRSPKNLSRREPRRVPAESILIVCEGKTEKNYFQGLKAQIGQSPVRIDITTKPSRSSPAGLIRSATALKEAQDGFARRGNNQISYDQVWCVFDTEGRGRSEKELEEAVAVARALKYRVAISNPCFEFWYLLHFKYTTASFQNCAKVVSELKKHYKRYKKSDPAFSEKIFPNTDVAIKNSKDIFRRHGSNDPLRCNPSTTVYKLVEILQAQHQVR